MSTTLIAELRGLAVQFAREHTFLADPDEAAGRCFWSALAFAWMAENHGHQVQLIRWRLAADPDFNDHWAVVLHGTQIIDHTRSQVDGQTGLFWRVTDYPPNYFGPRRYPASMLLPDFERQHHQADGQLPLRYMASVQAHLAAYDANYYRAPPLPAYAWGLVVLALANLVVVAWLALK